MAGVYVGLVMQGALGLDPGTKLVLVALAECANVKDHGVTFPSVARLARYSCLTERHVQRILRELVEATWITVERASKGGYGQTTRYRLNLPKLRAGSTKNPDAHVTDQDGHNGDADVRVNGDASVRVEPPPNPDAHVATTLTFGAQNPDAHVTRSFEPEGTGNAGARAREAASPTSLREILNRKGLKAEGPEPEEGATRNASAPTAKPAPRSREEQIAFVERALAKGGGEP